MGFISFSLDYYKTQLQKLEPVPTSRDSIYLAKQLLKMLDDRVDVRMYTTYPYLMDIYGDRIDV